MASVKRTERRQRKVKCSKPLYCFCRRPDDHKFMIFCGDCEEWFHAKCVGVSEVTQASLNWEEISWMCPACVRNLNHQIKQSFTRNIQSETKLWNHLKMVLQYQEQKHAIYQEIFQSLEEQVEHQKAEIKELKKMFQNKNNASNVEESVSADDSSSKSMSGKKLCTASSDIVMGEKMHLTELQKTQGPNLPNETCLLNGTTSRANSNSSIMDVEEMPASEALDIFKATDLIPEPRPIFAESQKIVDLGISNKVNAFIEDNFWGRASILDAKKVMPPPPKSCEINVEENKPIKLKKKRLSLSLSQKQRISKLLL